MAGRCWDFGAEQTWVGPGHAPSLRIARGNRGFAGAMAALGLWALAAVSAGANRGAVGRAAPGSGTRGGVWVAKLGFEHVHGLQEGGALAGGEAVEDPGQRGRGAVQPLLDDGPPGVADGDDGAAPVGRVGVPADQARPVEGGEDAAYGRQGQAGRGGEGADPERAAPP